MTSVKRLAELSKLCIAEDKVRDLEQDINQIIEYFGIIKELNADKEEVYTQNKKLSLRDDKPVNEYSKEEMLKNAKNKNNEFIRVPKTVE